MSEKQQAVCFIILMALCGVLIVFAITGCPERGHGFNRRTVQVPTNVMGPILHSWSASGMADRTLSNYLNEDWAIRRYIVSNHGSIKIGGFDGDSLVTGQLTNNVSK
jgi:hypothetical protein